MKPHEVSAELIYLEGYGLVIGVKQRIYLPVFMDVVAGDKVSH